MIYVGIDPGQKGGVAFVSNKGEEFVVPMPDEHELQQILKTWDSDFGIKHVFLEKAFCVRGQGLVSTFNYADGYGAIRGILRALELPFTLIPPKEWQKEMFKGTKEPKPESKKGPKERALEAVKRLFPKQRFIGTIRSRVPHDGMIDSILIAEFCRRKII